MESRQAAFADLCSLISDLLALKLLTTYLFGLAGTFAPFLRASERPMAIACFRLVTFLPLRPLFNLPRFISCISRSTFLPAEGLYLRVDFFDAFFAGAFFTDFFLAAFLAVFFVAITILPFS